MASASDCKQGRFAEITNEEQNIILENIDAKNTKRSTNTAVKVLREYLQQKGKSGNFENLLVEELDSTLVKFYLEARTEKGEHYKQVTLMSYRHGIQRFLEKIRKDVDIIRGENFKSSITTFKAMGKELKRIGFAEVKHYPPIADADMEKLYDYVCSSDSPVILQHKVFIDIMLHFGRRGRENLAALKITDLAVTTDADGDMYVYMCSDEQTKNHQEDGDRAHGRLYEKKDNPRCPVRSFIKYIRRLNKDCLKLFQQPNSDVEDGNSYYYAVALGHNRLGSMMPTLSIKAGLSMKYTNHSLRATTVHVLDCAQVPTRHIMTVTGHKAESSLKTYTGYTDDKAKKRMSATISDKTCAQVKDAKMPSVDDDDDDLSDFLRDCDFDEIIQNMSMPEVSVSSQVNGVHVLNQGSTSNRCMFQVPGPIMNNCSVTINYNFHSK